MKLRQVGNMVRICMVMTLLIPAAWVFGQNTTSCAISGTVTDLTGAVVSNVTVTVTNQATHDVRTVDGNAQGFFTAENLPGGDYTLTIVSPGFQQSVITNLHLDPGQRRGQDVKLSVGSTTATITVEANSVAVQTESAESSGTISSKEVANLMLNGRNFQQLATLVPGVSSVTGANSQVNSGYLGQTSLIVGGASVEQTTYTIDGIYDMTPSALINVNITPSIDVIDEMRVLKNAYSARYGYAGSGQILIQTKSGTSNYHGTGYEYLRSNSLGVARDYATSGVPTPASSLHFNIYGFTVGGPLLIPHLYHAGRNKTFFFVGAEVKTNNYASTLNSRSEFTPAIRGGDLSLSYTGTSAKLSGNAAIKSLGCDTYCQTLLAARGLTAANCFSKDSNGVTNQINTNCFDTASAYFINPANNFLPLPNLPQNNNTQYANYINSKPERDNQNDTFYRVDHMIGDKHAITVRYMHEEVNDLRPARNYNDPSPNPGATVYTPAMNALVRWGYTINPNLINTANLAYTDQKVQLNPTGNYNIPAGLITQAFNNNDNRLPGVGIGSYWSWLGVGAQPNYSKSGDGIVSDDVSYIRGQHVLSAGAFYMWNIIRLNASSFGQGNFSFGSSHTGDVAGDFLLGFLSTYSQASIQRAGVFHQRWAEFYAQDDWKVNPKLTVNYGIRYSYIGSTTKEGNDISNFVPSQWSASLAPVVTPQGAFANNPPQTSSGTAANYTTNGMVSACNGIPCGITTPKKALFGPRLGFALRLNAAGTLSLHGGYGMGYTQVGMFQTSGLLSNLPYVSVANYSNTQFSNPAGGTQTAPGLQAPAGLDSTYRPAAVQAWSLTLEGEVVPHGILTVAYAGTKTDHIFTSGLDRNYPQMKTTTYTANCASNILNIGTAPNRSYDFDPCLNSANNTNTASPGYNASAKQTNSNYYRPYQGYGSISSGASIGMANYNALQSGFIYRLHAVQLNLAYTWSKTMGNQNPTTGGVGYDSATSYSQPYNPSADYGLPDFDRTHVFTGAVVYETPFFQHSNSFLARKLLSHWGISGLATIESGFAQTFGLSSTTSGLTSRPNVVGALVRNSGTSGKAALSQKPLYSYSSFALPAYGYFGNGRVGTARGPREVNFASAINKTFPITEKVGFQLRAEAFNIFNHPNIQNVNLTFNQNASTNASSFGYVSSSSSVQEMRKMEFSGRITF
ncbi:MAG: TonB-dependent receptor [Terracidiphilus sp.]|nr:TonB-dependent receptor [Terracidiphilus sp.]